MSKGFVIFSIGAFVILSYLFFQVYNVYLETSDPLGGFFSIGLYLCMSVTVINLAEYIADKRKAHNQTNVPGVKNG